jgi:tryptophan-rich sensory protein
MKERISSLLTFTILNFLALALGVYLMNGGPVSEWYINLNQAPWTPPNPVFGIAWSFIMLCFGFYLSKVYQEKSTRSLLVKLYSLQWVLNVSWNYIFFNQHQVLLGLINLLVLFTVVFIVWIRFKDTAQRFSWLIVPYLLWMLLAISLNGYIYFNN